MNNRHHVLVVEDDPPMAEELCVVLEAMGHTFAVVNNKQDALAALSSSSFCLVLLDLEIKANSTSIKPHVEVGHRLLEEVRSRRPDVVPRGHRYPILVVSGHAPDADEAVRVMQSGASSLVQKRVGQNFSKAIQGCLDVSGRTDHASCVEYEAAAEARPTSESGLLLSIPGPRVNRRTRICVSGRCADITDSALLILLRLIVGKFENKPVHKRDFGVKDEYGFKGVSRLEEQLRAILPPNTRLVKNLWHGNYSLVPEVAIGNIDQNTIDAADEGEATSLAQQLAVLRRRPPKV